MPYLALVITIQPDPVPAHRQVTITVSGAPCDPHDVKIEFGGGVVESFDGNEGTSSTNVYSPPQAGSYTVSVECGGVEQGSAGFTAT